MAYAELTLDQGATFLASLDLANDDGTPVNIADATFQSQIRKSYYSTSATANLIVSVVSQANAKISLSLPAEQTANIKAGRYLYDLKMTSGNTTTRIIEGIITVTPQVSR
jgi:hypothetical protein